MNPKLYPDFCKVCHKIFDRREEMKDDLYDHIMDIDNGVVFGICPNCIEKAANK